MTSQHAVGLLALVAFGAAACGSDVQGPGQPGPSGPTASLRIVHTVAGVPAVDVYVAEQRVLSNVALGQVTGFVAVPAGAQAVAFRAAGAGAATPATTLQFATSDSLTILTIDSASVLNPWVLSDTGAVVPAGKSKLRVVHFAAGAPAIDIWRTQPDFQSWITVQFPFRYRDASPYLQSDPGDWRVLVSTETRDGNGIPVLTDTLLLSEVIGVPAGTSRTVVVLDRAGGGLQAVVMDP